MFQAVVAIFFILLMPIQATAEVAPLAVGESIDDFFGRISYGVTGRTCEEADLDEYVGFRCGMDRYFFSNDNSFGSGTRSGSDFFQGVTDSIVFNTAADSVHSMNQCQVNFYEHYFRDNSARGTLQTRAVASFNEIRGLVRQRKRRIIDINTPTTLERMSLPCATSTECAMMNFDLENRTDDALERDSRLTELLASVPMGNRPQMRNYLVSVADQNIDEPTFRRGYDRVMRELETEAKTSYGKIHEYYRETSDGKHHFEIDSDLRRSLINNGIVGNILAEHQLENFASTTNFMCRIDRRNEGMWVGAGAEVVLAIAAAFVTRGATAEVTPYVLATMRTGSILRRLANGERLVAGASAGLSKSTTAKLLLYGAAHTVEAMMTYKDISENCFGPEYLASLANEGCSAESQMYNVQAEASIAACAVSATLGVALPVSMVAVNRVGTRGARVAGEIAEDIPSRTLVSSAPSDPPIIVSVSARREFALSADEARSIEANLNTRNISAATTLDDSKLVDITPNERIFLIEAVADTAFSPSQGRSIIDIVAHAQRRGLQNNDIARLSRILRDSGVETSEVNRIISRIRSQRLLDSAPNAPRVTLPTRRPHREPLGRMPNTEAEVIAQYSSRVVTTPAENARYLQLADSTRAQTGVVFVDTQNSMLKFLNDNLHNKNLVDAFNNRHSLMLQESIEGLRRRYPTLQVEVYSDYKGIRFAVKGPAGSEARLATDLRRVTDEVDANFQRELQNGNFASVTGRARDERWFSTGVDDTADLSNLMARTGKTRAEIEALWNGVRGKRQRLEQRFGNSPLMRSVEGEVNSSIPTAEVFELLRKNRDNNEVARILNHRHGVTINATDVGNFREYADEVDFFSPNLRIDSRVTHNFDNATDGGVTLDFGGVGSLNAEATAEGLAQGFSLKRSVMNVRANEIKVTEYLDRVKSETQTAVSDVLSRHNITSVITTSGDDMVVVPNAPLTDSIKNEIIQAQARAQANLYQETGRNTNVRVSYFGSNIATSNERAILAVEGEGIEKILRTRLEFLIPYNDLKRLTIGTDMLGTARGTGTVGLRTNTALTPAQNTILEREFRQAVIDANTAHGTNFVTAP